MILFLPLNIVHENLLCWLKDQYRGSKFLAFEFKYKAEEQLSVPIKKSKSLGEVLPWYIGNYPEEM